MADSRMSADERRASILDAAVSEFARNGYAGTSTETIAVRAGISQPYLFRLFGTKKELFIATYDRVGSRITSALTEAGQGLEGEEILTAKGAAYLELMQDPEILQVQLHGFAASCGDDDIAASCRTTFKMIWNMLTEQVELDEEEMRQFFAMGMMISVMTAINLLSIPEEWARSFCPDPEKYETLAAASRRMKTLRSGLDVDDTNNGVPQTREPQRTSP